MWLGSYYRPIEIQSHILDSKNDRKEIFTLKIPKFLSYNLSASLFDKSRQIRYFCQKYVCILFRKIKRTLKLLKTE